MQTNFNFFDKRLADNYNVDNSFRPQPANTDERLASFGNHHFFFLGEYCAQVPKFEQI